MKIPLYVSSKYFIVTYREVYFCIVNMKGFMPKLSDVQLDY